ncbi:MAG: hypothetical protein EHM45_11175 [Desulfobacteraceae bacterium]|nr:MAG: hypothetical protein EHM45_11175 [Desulfobacteraceae bacterium]
MKKEQERLEYYRKHVYEKGGLIKSRAKKALDLSVLDRFRYCTRYFPESGIIGSKEFVSQLYQRFKSYFSSCHDKITKTIRGLKGIYSLKRLSENIA